LQLDEKQTRLGNLDAIIIRWIFCSGKYWTNWQQKLAEGMILGVGYGFEAQPKAQTLNELG
jgi:hypothetical protein